jgi:hypothetical protein
MSCPPSAHRVCELESNWSNTHLRELGRTLVYDSSSSTAVTLIESRRGVWQWEISELRRQRKVTLRTWSLLFCLQHSSTWWAHFQHPAEGRWVRCDDNTCRWSRCNSEWTRSIVAGDCPPDMRERERSWALEWKVINVEWELIWLVFGSWRNRTRSDLKTIKDRRSNKEATTEMSKEDAKSRKNQGNSGYSVKFSPDETDLKLQLQSQWSCLRQQESSGHVECLRMKYNRGVREWMIWWCRNLAIH